MEYRLPRVEDIDLIKSYIEDRYLHGEYSLSASNMLTSIKWEDLIKK